MLRVIPDPLILLLREKHRLVASELPIDPPNVVGRSIESSEDLSKAASVGEKADGRKVEGGREETSDLDDGFERGSRKFEGLLVDDLGCRVLGDSSMGFDCFRVDQKGRHWRQRAR